MTPNIFGGHHHVGHAFDQRFAFDVTDKVHRSSLQQLVSFLQHSRALVFFFAHIEEADLRVFVTEVGLGEGRTGNGEIHQGSGAFVDVSTGIDQDDRAVSGRNHAAGKSPSRNGASS